MPNDSELPITNLNGNDAAPASDTSTESVEDLIARGAAAAMAEGDDTAPGAVSEPDIIIGEKPKRRRGRKPKEPVLTPEEAKAAADLAAFFSPEGIGTVWAGGISAFYSACGAPPLSPEETGLHATVFSQWARYRLPAGANQYQPDILLLGTLVMTSLPRAQPIATTTAPLWVRLGRWLKSKLPRKAVPGRALP